jgi:menaquinol-cytochrome c reductase iron-sulfur subunit
MNDLESRRRFLSRMSLAASGLIAVVVNVPILSYLLSPLINPARPSWRQVGAQERFKIGATVQVALEDPSPVAWAGQTALTAAWLRRTSETGFTAFAVNCTHLGCPVNWLEDARLFLCPCHGGVYNADGTVAGGPPPRPLLRYDVRVRQGQVEILARGVQFA